MKLCGILVMLSAVLMAGAGFATSAPSIAPSFDCAKAVSAVEKAICESEDLSKLDVDLARVYGEALAKGDKPTLQTAQKQWLTERDACPADDYITDCVSDLYRGRLQQLEPAEGVWIVKNVDEGLPNVKVQHVYAFASPWSEAQEYAVELRFDEKLFDAPEYKWLLDETTSKADEIYSDFVKEYDTGSSLSDSYSLSYEGAKLASISQTNYSYEAGAAHGGWGDSYVIYDRALKAKLKFSDLFNPSDKAEVNKILAAELLKAVKDVSAETLKKEKAEGTDMPADFVYYYPDIDKQFEEFAQKGFGDHSFGVSASDGVLADEFIYGASAYEFGPYAVSAIYVDMKIDARPLLPFIKPEYRDSFVK